MKGGNMRRWMAVAATLAVVAGSGIGAGVVRSAAQTAPPPIAVEALTGRAVFTDDVDLKVKLSQGGETKVVKTTDPSRMATFRFTVQPGARFPWHTHYGPVFVNVVQGSFTFVDGETCGERTYPTGAAFVDLGHGHVHSGYNPGTTEAVLVATFFELPATASPLIPADTPSCAA
jgi:quercetin dioxygenase-like cupin family protein